MSTGPCPHGLLQLHLPNYSALYPLLCVYASLHGRCVCEVLTQCVIQGHTRAPSVSSANSAFRKAAAAATAAQEEAEQFERWQKQRLQEAKRQKQVFRSRQKAFLGSSIRYRSAPAIGFGSGRRSADAKVGSCAHQRGMRRR